MEIFEYIKQTYNTPEDMLRLIQYANGKSSSTDSPNMLCFSSEILYYQFLYCKNHFRKTSLIMLEQVLEQSKNQLIIMNQKSAGYIKKNAENL